VTFAAGESKTVTFSAASYASVLRITNPRLWWPWQMGAQEFYSLSFSFVLEDKQVSDTISNWRVGLREVTSEIDKHGHRLYYVNGQPILIRGAGWTPDLFQRYSAARQEAELQYVRDMNLNTVRMEGKFEDEHFYDVCDELGLLVMTGWCCCDAWQRWTEWGAEQHWVARESLRSQVRRLRSHPSVFVFLSGSDLCPTVDVESEFLEVFALEQWPNPTLSSATSAKSTLTGPSGVKMSGPYSYVPPNYWLTDKQSKYGGAYGFLTEGGPGENPLLAEAVRRTLSVNHREKIDDFWDYHCGNTRGFFGKLSRFTEPLTARYGAMNGLVDISRKSAAAVYESHRAMFEAYTRNRYVSTGVIQWMQNNAWPSMIWHLYDWYLVPDAAYFATKKACEPVHAIYGYDDSYVWISNSMFQKYARPLQVTAQVVGLDGSLLWKNAQHLNELGPDAVIRLFEVPASSFPSGVFFLRLDVASDTELVSANTYWLHPQMDVLAWD
jgi:exo-1,4-beta-D-glucosaminidase